MPLINSTYEKDEEEWDIQLVKDAKDGKLDFLIEKALQEEINEALQNL